MALDRKLVPITPDTPLDRDGDNFRVPTGGARGVLTPAEIEALLRPDIPEDAFEEPKEVTAYAGADLSGEGIGDALRDDAGVLAARLTLALRKACQLPAIVTVQSAMHSPLSYLVSQEKGEPVLVLFADQHGDLVAGLTLDARLAITIIDQVCGGNGQGRAPLYVRKLSLLDKSILEEVLRPLASALDPSFSIACIEANRSAAHALLPPGKAKLAELSCQIGEVVGRAAFARLLPETARHGREVGHEPTGLSPGAGRMQTSLTARIASLSVPVSHLADLKAGSILLLGLPADQPVELLSGGYQGEVLAEGDIGRKGNKVAVRVTKCKPVF